MALVFILLVTAVLLGGGVYYGYRARKYDFRQLAGALFAVAAVLTVFFMLANKD